MWAKRVPASGRAAGEFRPCRDRSCVKRRTSVAHKLRIRVSARAVTSGSAATALAGLLPGVNQTVALPVHQRVLSHGFDNRQVPSRENHPADGGCGKSLDGPRRSRWSVFLHGRSVRDAWRLQWTTPGRARLFNRLVAQRAWAGVLSRARPRRRLDSSAESFKGWRHPQPSPRSQGPLRVRTRRAAEPTTCCSVP